MQVGLFCTYCTVYTILFSKVHAGEVILYILYHFLSSGVRAGGVIQYSLQTNRGQQSGHYFAYFVYPDPVDAISSKSDLSFEQKFRQIIYF